MYTEENEFDYEEYDNKNKNGKFKNTSLIVKIILIAICLLIIIFLVVKVKNLGKNNNNNNNVANNNSSVVFNSNLVTLRYAAEKYFFEENKYPKNVDEVVSANITTLKEKTLNTEINDYDGKKCGYNSSYVSLVRNKNNYIMTIYLSCPSMEDTLKYYYDLKFRCLTCNGEDYEDVEDEKESEKEDEKEPEKDNNTSNDKEENIAVCGNFTEWTTSYIEDPTLDREQRTVVKAFKDNNVYGQWSEPTTNKIEPTDTLDVSITQKKENVNKYPDTWIDTGTSKPESKEGRQIETYSTSTPYKSQSCKNETQTYTKEVAGGDPKVPCTRKSGSLYMYVCTYKKTVEKCTSTTKYSSVTNYKYRDSQIQEELVTYYQSRTITKGEPVYTGYILETEIPEGYQKLEGSEITQYRYREKCRK